MTLETLTKQTHSHSSILIDWARNVPLKKVRHSKSKFIEQRTNIAERQNQKSKQFTHASNAMIQFIWLTGLSECDIDTFEEEMRRKNLNIIHSSLLHLNSIVKTGYLSTI